eukprot:jgi/Botrbrau1/22846/Bobra.0065s0005.1
MIVLGRCFFQATSRRLNRHIGGTAVNKGFLPWDFTRLLVTTFNVQLRCQEMFCKGIRVDTCVSNCGIRSFSSRNLGIPSDPGGVLLPHAPALVCISRSSCGFGTFKQCQNHCLGSTSDFQPSLRLQARVSLQFSTRSASAALQSAFIGKGDDLHGDTLQEQDAEQDDGAEAAEVSGPTEARREDLRLPAGLYLVGTPIGNLEDITWRAVRCLRDADTVLAEDTRHSRKLLNHLGIRRPLLSYHAHNEREREALVLRLLRQGQSVALISDAGMPGVSDPGSALVEAAVSEGHPVVPVPRPPLRYWRRW